MSKAEQAGKRAFELHQSGFHCAEAIFTAVVETYSDQGADFSPRVATAFGGGMGRTCLETCGTLTGGLLALGALLGRDEPGENWDRVADLTAEFRRRFEEEYGSTNCRALLDAFGPQEDFIRCKHLSSQAAQMLGKLLKETGAV